MVLFYLQIQDDFWKRQIIFDKMRRIFRGRLSRSRSKGGIIGKILFPQLTYFCYAFNICVLNTKGQTIHKSNTMIQIIYKF